MQPIMEIGGNICKLIHLTCLISTVTCSWIYPFKFTFRCQDTGSYISDNYFCNGVVDCLNGEDEINGCDKSITCGSDRSKSYVCDQQCKDLHIRCNGIKDCEDGTDELDCGSGIDVKNCTDESKFLCKDGLRCLELYNTCDGLCNCFDCSDEEDINCEKDDYNLSVECADSYFNTAKGPKCYCNSSNADFRAFCERVHSCTTYSQYCDQRCIKIDHKIQCSCFEDFHPYIHKDLLPEDLTIDGITECRKNDWRETVIVYATEDEIKLLNVTTNIASKILDKVYNITALAIANNYVYYALKLPSDKGRIFKTSIYSGKSERIINAGLKVTSLEVDYITNNVYFITNGSLSVCKNDGSICLELDCCDVNEVALAPKSGLMFYLKKIPKRRNGFVLTRSNMAGDDKITFGEYVYQGDIFSFVVDEPTAKLYLLEIIHNVKNNKTEVHRIPFRTGYTEKTITAVAVRNFGTYDSRIFFTSWEKDYENYIFFAFSMSSLAQNDWNNEWLPHYITHNNSASISHLDVHNGILHSSNKNPCDESSCSGLCLLRPGTSSKFNLTYRCLPM